MVNELLKICIICVNMEAVLDKTAELVIYNFEPSARKIPMREKHLNTAIATLIGIMLAHVPLIYGYTPIKTPDNLVTFRVDGTWMQLGTQPFVFASMAAGFIFNKDEHIKSRARALGFLFATVLASKWSFWMGHHWFCAVQLIVISYIILQAMVYLDTYGSIHLSTALICAHASENIVRSVVSVSILWAIALILLVSWIEGLCVTMPLTHMRRKSETMSMSLPVMYNSTTSLVMYYTVIEMLSSIYEPFAILQSNNIAWATVAAAPALFIGVYSFNRVLPELEEKSGRHLIKKWQKQQYTIKGWRSQHKMAKYIQNIIDRNVYWNTIMLFGLWCLGVIFKPPISVTTLFILISTAKQTITQPISSLWS